MLRRNRLEKVAIFFAVLLSSSVAKLETVIIVLARISVPINLGIIETSPTSLWPN